jgi:hypothetical protein
MRFRARKSARRRALWLATALAVLAAVSIAVGVAGAAQQSARPAKGIGAGQSTNGGIIEASRYLGRNSRVPVEVSGNKFVQMRKLIKQRRHLRALMKKQFRTFGTPAAVGDTRAWLALDDTLGFYRKQFVLRKLSNNTEIWVAKDVPRILPGGTASGTNFLPGDCRNGERTTITNAQVDYLAQQFDDNILPKESVEFSVAPDRTGANETATATFGPTFQGVPIDPTGAGQRTVVLIDNVRDDNFYDLNNTQGFSYIAGFFSPGLNALFDRNIMTVDAFDWLHRTGANPPHEPVAGNLCTSAPARPFLYEGVFAHEYQHLLESYADPDEVNWVNEGLSDFAIDVTGYDFPERTVSQIGFDSHLQCFMGNLVTQTDANPNPRGGGPENSLTRWSDQGDGEILCDYGAAFSFMEYLAGQYGTAFMSQLHHASGNGLLGLQQVLANRATSQQVVHRWAVAMAIDAVLDGGTALRDGVNPALYQIAAMHAGVNWDNADAYSTPGAPPNGSDYARLRNGSGAYLDAASINSISFEGDRNLPSLPVEWLVDANPFGHAGNAALYSGSGDSLDRAIVKSVAVPSGGSPALTFVSQWNTEVDSLGGWDYGFVQVSTDGGATYHSIACTDTSSNVNPGAIPTVQSNLPGFNGDSNGWRPESCSLAPYAGQTVLVAFRYVTDTNTRGSPTGNDRGVPDGWWVDDVAVGSTSLSDGSSLAGWQSPTQAHPIPVNGFTVQLVAYSANSRTPPAIIASLPLNSNFRGSLSGGALRGVIRNQADVVAAIVMYDEPTEALTQYAPYTLRVNGVTQPGGR